MKKIFLVLALAFAFTTGMTGLHARTTTPPVYLVVEIDEVTDANGFEALRQTADATAVEVQFEDGRYFASTENVTALDGNANPPCKFAVKFRRYAQTLRTTAQGPTKFGQPATLEHICSNQDNTTLRHAERLSCGGR